jgi:hypothetical protein
MFSYTGTKLDEEVLFTKTSTVFWAKGAGVNKLFHTRKHRIKHNNKNILIAENVISFCT